MRVTLIIGSLALGGAERVMSLMANYWATHGWSITLITLVQERPFFDLEPGVRHVPLGVTGESATPIAAVWNNIKRVWALRRAIQASKPQAVISFLDVTNILTILATRGMRVPVIVSERTVPDPTIYSPGKAWVVLRRWVYPWADRVVLQSKHYKQFFSPAVRKISRVIPNPVVLPEQPRVEQNTTCVPSLPPTSEKMIIGLGRLHASKGFDLLVQAFARVAPKYPNWRLTIWGEGPERDNLETQRQRLHLEDRVSLPGATRQPYDVMQQADMFVLSSRIEGFPNALCEAMASGLPVISFDCPFGPREVVRDGIDGLLVPDSDVDALAQAMDNLMADEAMRLRLATRAPDVVERFGIQKVMEMWDHTIQGALS
ncbi:MAG: glycosyltransferase family 4 protein [Chloroflexaceae bacterium]|nr:glycosyltransferase family 4 protein [Chloroflexaceae bacterium]